MQEKNDKLVEKTMQYIQQWFYKMGIQVVYASLLLFFAFRSKATPGWAKNIIIGALAYFVSPIDGIPDLSPFLGFTDDLGVMSFALVAIACYIDKPVRQRAKIELRRLFKNYKEEELLEVDRIL